MKPRKTPQKKRRASTPPAAIGHPESPPMPPKPQDAPRNTIRTKGNWSKIHAMPLSVPCNLAVKVIRDQQPPTLTYNIR